MISKAKAKFIKSLQLKKYRKEEQCFTVEGAKGVAELLHSDFEAIWVAATDSFLQEHKTSLGGKKIEVIETNSKELSELGTFSTNNAALAIARLRPNTEPKLKNEFAIVLDDIRDPGNLGTIIRTADWYGIKNIIASEETADFYNPKVINATMGSFCRVNMFYTSLSEFLFGTDWPLFGASLTGKSIYEMDFGKEGFIVIGNEAQGISAAVHSMISQHITIPRIGRAESLNASIATAIILDNVFRSKK
jgi:RNA methyltransferase, TrmH family